jgi:hypothetical protein
MVVLVEVAVVITPVPPNVIVPPESKYPDETKLRPLFAVTVPTVTVDEPVPPKVAVLAAAQLPEPSAQLPAPPAPGPVEIHPLPLKYRIATIAAGRSLE